MRISENRRRMLAGKCYCRALPGGGGKYRSNSGMGRVDVLLIFRGRMLEGNKLSSKSSANEPIAPSPFLAMSPTRSHHAPAAEREIFYSTVKAVALVAVPPSVVTDIFPVVAPVGTDVEISVSEFTVNAADVPLNDTLVV
jgi:hypothetical protein